MVVFGILIGLIILMLLVTAHEFGHFIMARKNGVRVKEFGICFPPRMMAWVKKDNKWVRLPKSEWEKEQDGLIFSLNWLPIGGFCSMDGETDSDTRPGTLGAASFWAKTKILFGGVLMNWLVAFVLLTILAFTGMPQFLPNQFEFNKQDGHVINGQGVIINKVIEGSPAEKAGLRAGDYISMLDHDGDAPMLYPADVIKYGQDHAGEIGKYFIYTPTDTGPKDGRWVEVHLNPAGSEYNLGAELGYSQAKIRYTWSAPLVGLGTTLQLTGETFKGLGDLVWSLGKGVAKQFSTDASTREDGQAALAKAGDSVSGPVGIIGVIFPTFASSGAANLTFLAALVSVSLACMNVLPIPALDGGRWLLIAIFRLRKKPLTKETEERIVSRAFMFLIGLIVVITILDIIKLF